MKNIKFSFYGFVLFILFITLAANANELKFTVLYNNYDQVSGTTADWGFACLVEGTEKTILFDTGADGKILMRNVRQLGVDLHKVDILVLSHNHNDHTGGVDSVLVINPDVVVYILNSFPTDFTKQHHLPESSVQHISKAIEICPNVFTTGEMGNSIKEHSLIFYTGRGQFILTGCSHQGIIEILEKAKSLSSEPIYLVLGGMHLLRHSDVEVQKIIQKFRELGINKCAATHCTGDKAMKLFAESFKDNFINAGTGTVITISEK